MQTCNVTVTGPTVLFLLRKGAGLRGACFNVRINLPHTGDEDFVTEMESELATLLSDSGAMCEAIQQQVENLFVRQELLNISEEINKQISLLERRLAQ